MSTSTRSTLLLAVPLAFVAGVVVMAAMTRLGVVSVNSAKTSSGLFSSSTNASVSVDANTGAADLASGQLAKINERLQELEQQLQASTNQADLTRAQTDKKLEELDKLARRLEQNIGNTDSLTANQSEGTAVIHGEQNAGLGGMFANRRFGPADGQEQYNNLLLAGVDPYVAQEIQQRNDQWSLERLELIDQATREGWRESDEFGERMRALRETRPDLRSELGDDDYDSYLYTSGDSNRVAVSSIINGSAAQQSGMQNGDVVVSYANNRVFGSRELQRATRDGQKGESVQVEVLRNGQVITVDVPRGPLGVTLTGSRVDPAE